MKLFLLILAALIVAAYFLSGCKSGRNSTGSSKKEFQHGPFTIRVEANTSKTLNMNYGFVNTTSVRYSIFHEGKPVKFPGALENNTGIPFLWRVYALSDMPEPTLIAGSQSLYLIYLNNGQPVVEPLLQQGSDFASLQFLDSRDGQPGLYTEVYMRHEIDSMDKLETLQGGKLLLIGEHVVFEPITRKTWPLNKDNHSIDNYSFPTPHGALAFSPDRKTIVFHANFDSWNTSDENLPDSEHALVAYDFEKDAGYVVKYDDTDTRMINVQEADLRWFNTYFEWEKTPGANDRLRLRKLDKLPNWTGRYNPDDHYYTLYPVTPGIVPVFQDFVLQQMGWSQSNILEDTTSEYTGRGIKLGAGEVKLDITFYEDDQKLTFSKHLYAEDTPEYRQLVRKISEAFNAELASGKYQEHFGRIISETKKIRGK